MPNDEALLETLQKMSMEVEINMQTVKERWEEQAALKARAEGIAEGIAKGEMKGIAGIVGNMIKGGFSVKHISKMTKLPIARIQELYPEES